MILRANEQVLDIYKDERILINFSVNDIGDYESREGAYSNTFKLPQTDNNKRVLNYANEIGSGTETKYNTIQATIEEGGTVLIGFIRIRRITKDIEVVFFASNAKWYDEFKNTTLYDLVNIGDYQLSRNITSIIDSWNNTDGFQLLLLNTNIDGVFTNGDLEGRRILEDDFFPCFFLKGLIKNGFENKGYKISGSFLNNPIFSKLIIPTTNFDRDGVGSSPDLKEYVPKIKILDILKYLTNAFGLIFQFDPLTNNIKIEYYNQITNNIINGIVLDISQKIEIKKEPEINYTPSGYGQKNLLKYGQDTSDLDLPLNYGQGELNINSDYLVAEKVIYTAPFYATPLKVVSTVGNADPISIVNIFDPKKIRILIATGIVDIADISDGTSINIYFNLDGSGGVSANVTEMAWAYFIKENVTGAADLIKQNLSFGNEVPADANLIDTYLGIYDRIFENYALMQIECYLTKQEIDQIDFLVPVYSQKHGRYFILNKIIDYNIKGNEVTTLELLNIS